jgi:hypothetical protein
MTDVPRPKIRQFDFDGVGGEIIGFRSIAASSGSDINSHAPSQ